MDFICSLWCPHQVFQFPNHPILHSLSCAIACMQSPYLVKAAVCLHDKRVWFWFHLTSKPRSLVTYKCRILLMLSGGASFLELFQTPCYESWYYEVLRIKQTFQKLWWLNSFSCFYHHLHCLHVGAIFRHGTFSLAQIVFNGTHSVLSVAICLMCVEKYLFFPISGKGWLIKDLFFFFTCMQPHMPQGNRAPGDWEQIEKKVHSLNSSLVGLMCYWCYCT